MEKEKRWLDGELFERTLNGTHHNKEHRHRKRPQGTQLETDKQRTETEKDKRWLDDELFERTLDGTHH
ncbi:hypothetical protein H0H87_005045, partial [Tephrocybe sp. NHM501043]